MMIAGPALVDWAKLGDVSKEELGAQPHPHAQRRDRRRSGERSRSVRARAAFLSYLPTNVDELPPVVPTNDDPKRREEFLLDVVPSDPRKVYKMRAGHRGGGRSRQLLRNRPPVGQVDHHRSRPARRLCRSRCSPKTRSSTAAPGPPTRAAKLTRFIDLSAIFHLPLVHLVDCPGFLIGKQSEEDSTIRFGSTTLAALGQSPVPFVSVVVRKAFGVAGAANHKPGSHHVRVAWPSGDWGSLPIEGGIEVAYKAELAESPDPDAHLAAIKARLNRLRSPFRSAEYFEIEEIIDPRDTRAVLTRWVQLARRRLRPGGVAFGYRP